MDVLVLRLHDLDVFFAFVTAGGEGQLWLRFEATVLTVVRDHAGHGRRSTMALCTRTMVSRKCCGHGSLINAAIMQSECATWHRRLHACHGSEVLLKKGQEACPPSGVLSRERSGSSRRRRIPAGLKESQRVARSSSWNRELFTNKVWRCNA